MSLWHDKICQGYKAAALETAIWWLFPVKIGPKFEVSQPKSDPTLHPQVEQKKGKHQLMHDAVQKQVVSQENTVSFCRRRGGSYDDSDSPSPSASDADVNFQTPD